jgi:hypothetical protein
MLGSVMTPVGLLPRNYNDKRGTPRLAGAEADRRRSQGPRRIALRGDDVYFPASPPVRRTRRRGAPSLWLRSNRGGRDPAPAARFPNCSRQTVSRTAAGKRTAKKLIFLSELMVGAQEVGQASLINDLALGAGV